MPTQNSWDSNIPVEISKGGTNATTMATSNGTVIYDGTRLVTTAVGTAGQVLTSNGASAPTYQNQVFTKTLTVTSQQIKALVATPITLVAAAGANTVIRPLGVTIKFVYGGSNVFVAGASQTIDLRYVNAAGLQIFTAGILGNSRLVGTATQYGQPAEITLAGSAAGVMDNAALVIVNTTATEITGNAANDNSLIVNIVYSIATLV